MSQLSYEECIWIQVYLAEWYSHRKISRRLGRNNRTISEEIKKNSINGVYYWRIAHQIRKTKRRLANIMIHRRIRDKLKEYIEEKIKVYWSPEQIAESWKIESWERLSKDTVYKYIREEKKEYIKRYLRRKWEKYKYWTVKAEYIPYRKDIRERPEEANKRSNIWHREWDTMWWAKRRWWFLTIADRESSLVYARVLKEKKADEVIMQGKELYLSLPEVLRKTLTLDNGREFVNHYELWNIGIETYFADPYNPWQRWLNEHSNGLLRQFYPKGSDLWNVKQEELDKYIELVNNRPRKKLWRLSPYQYVAKKYCVLLN